MAKESGVELLREKGEGKSFLMLPHGKLHMVWQIRGKFLAGQLKNYICQ